MPHHRLLVPALLASVLAPLPALAREGGDEAACELAPALAALGRLAATAGDGPTGATLGVTATPTSVAIGPMGAAPLLAITCDGATVPAHGGRHARGPGWTLARGRHATSLDLAPGALFQEGVHILILDDGGLSVSLSETATSPAQPRPATLVYARELRATGDLVERETRRVGCGCERVTTPDGRKTERPLETPAAR
jgi:hypothetical protein